jgi:hypothetical protein
MHPILALAGATAVGSLAVRVLRLDAKRREAARADMLSALERAGYTSLGADLSWLPVGPFSAAILRHEAVFRVVAADAHGVRRSGWVRCPAGGKPEVVWEA